MTQSFDQIAEVVAKQMSSLLQTAVLISNADETIVASQRGDNGLVSTERVAKNESNGNGAGGYLKLPFHVYDQVGVVCIEQWVDGEKLSPKLAQACIDLMISQIVYPTPPTQQIFKNQVIYNLLQGQFKDESVALQQAALLGIDFAPPRAVILIDATEAIFSSSYGGEGSSYDQQRCAQAIIASTVTFFNLPDDTICADLGGGQFAVLKASDTKNLRPWATHSTTPTDELSSSWTNLEALKRAARALLEQLREATGTAVSIGIGRYHPGILGVSRSYQDARVALRLGRQFSGQARVYCLDDLGMAAFACVADERTKVDLALHLLSPLDNEPDLINTLKVFFAADCALSSAAKQLCIHRNTLTYRLEKITSLTGLDPRRFDEAVQIRLALLLQEFQGF
ncbi:PucR family transcriptional regulator [Leptolyngbya sp. KIOST-1]|uniref:PucR family transcriptional regulator n=1 Tax=Leptolyngbya sp. KIOST-1 TaxID=1229172 RepID=UPI0005649190|nr:helix-turn-helix domain-containing protein [Leptolyngbya sp. KIOST-1]